jgi:hypothetical protein
VKKSEIIIFIVVLIVILVSVWTINKNQPVLDIPIENSQETPEEAFFIAPKDIGTKYIHAQEWPPTYVVGGGEPVCVESGSAIKEGGITKKVVMGKNEYCVTESSEGAAGSTYTTYTYLANLNASTLTLKFILKFVQCENYDEPQKGECLVERSKFDINKIIDDIYNSIDKA